MAGRLLSIIPCAAAFGYFPAIKGPGLEPAFDPFAETPNFIEYSCPDGKLALKTECLNDDSCSTCMRNWSDLSGIEFPCLTDEAGPATYGWPTAHYTMDCEGSTDGITTMRFFSNATCSTLVYSHPLGSAEDGPVCISIAPLAASLTSETCPNVEYGEHYCIDGERYFDRGCEAGCGECKTRGEKLETLLDVDACYLSDWALFDTLSFHYKFSCADDGTTALTRLYFDADCAIEAGTSTMFTHGCNVDPTACAAE